MSRAPKSREGDHFHVAIGLASELEGFVPEIPDWAFDMHTAEGKKKRRGLDHFRQEGALLDPPPEGPDRYKEEFYRLLALKTRSSGMVVHKSPGKPFARGDDLLHDSPSLTPRLRRPGTS
jgi:hypothetical protein